MKQGSTTEVRTTDCDVESLGGGVVVFRNAINIPQDTLIPYLEELKEKARGEMFTIVKGEDGAPLYALNQGGFKYDIAKMNKTPVRMMNLEHPFFQECEDALYKTLLQYVEMFPAILQCLWWRSEGHVLAYDEGAALGFHSDNDVNYRYGAVPPTDHATRNVLSALVYFNDSIDEGEEETPHSFSGGHMTIPYFDVDIRPRTGDICLFPANYLGAHEILEVTRGTRYSYLGWFAQGSEHQERGVNPLHEKKSEVIGGQYWMKTLVEDYEAYIIDKYPDAVTRPSHLLAVSSRQKDHTNEVY
jgi:predicted 2-oxoglutarate/Fe(II)-dependent dioxygenase YbiX